MPLENIDKNMFFLPFGGVKPSETSLLPGARKVIQQAIIHALIPEIQRYKHLIVPQAWPEVKSICQSPGAILNIKSRNVPE